PSRVAAPALGVKVDNVAAARPPTGLAPAEVVYVEPVEGGFHPTAGVVRGAETPGGRSGAQRAGKRSAAARPVRPSRARLFRRCSGAFATDVRRLGGRRLERTGTRLLLPGSRTGEPQQ